MRVKRLAQSVAQTKCPINVHYYYRYCHHHSCYAPGCVPNARESAWEATAPRSERQLGDQEGKMSLSGVLARPGLALRNPRGAAQLVCVGRAWGGGFWSFQQPIRWVGASWDVFHINVLGPHTPREMHAEQRKPRCAGNFLKPGRCPTQWLHVSMSPLETTSGLIPCPSLPAPTMLIHSLREATVNGSGEEGSSSRKSTKIF